MDMEDVAGVAALLDYAVHLFNNEKYAEAEAATRYALQRRMSNYQKNYAIALLADCMDDWYDAEVSRTHSLYPFILYRFDCLVLTLFVPWYIGIDLLPGAWRFVA
jgi:hypothetical protein